MKRIENVTKNGIEDKYGEVWKPSKKFLKRFMRDNIDRYIIQNLESIIDSRDWFEYIIEGTEDEEYLSVNFPSFTSKEVEEYIDTKYELESKFIDRLRRFLRKEESKMKTSYFNLSEEQREWEESIQW